MLNLKVLLPRCDRSFAQVHRVHTKHDLRHVVSEDRLQRQRANDNDWYDAAGSDIALTHYYSTTIPIECRLK